MLDYAHQRLRAALKSAQRAVLATAGPAGIQASEVACQAVDLALYLLVPETSDHLFNLENDPRVTLLAPGWELKGEAQVVAAEDLALLREPEAEWCVLVRVEPCQLQIRREGGWGNIETIDFER